MSRAANSPELPEYIPGDENEKGTEKRENLTSAF
jgi:hypothetical protein